MTENEQKLNLIKCRPIRDVNSQDAHWNLLRSWWDNWEPAFCQEEKGCIILNGNFLLKWYPDDES